VTVGAAWWPEARSGDLVAYLDDAELARLLAATEVAQAGPGDYLLHKGSPSRSVLLVEEGEIEIVDEVQGEPVVLGRVSAGGVVGEVGFLDGRPRTHDVRAGSACRVRRLTREGLLGLAESDPRLFAKITIGLAQLVARRFRGALAELDPVRALAASLGPDTTVVDERDAATPLSRAPADDDGSERTDTFEYDAIEDPILDHALDVLRGLARNPSKDLAGV
jgi:CRP-like cAMP-binding protein